MTNFIQISLQTYLSAITLTSYWSIKNTITFTPFLGVFSTKTLVFGAQGVVLERTPIYNRYRKTNLYETF